MSETRRMTSTAARINRSFTWRLITVLFWVNLLVLALALGGWCYYQEKAALGAAWQPNIWRSVQISSDVPWYTKPATTVYSFRAPTQQESHVVIAGDYCMRVAWMFIALLCAEFLMILCQYGAGRRRAERLLTPLRRMAETAQSLDKTFDTRKYHDLEEAISQVNVGVDNARIVVAAPVEVSGTAALAGILKAYESAASTQLSDEAKAVAGSEMVLTGDLADMIGSDDAVELLAMVKNAIAEYHLDDYDSLRPYVEQGAKQLGVQLTEDQIDQITKLGVQIAKLDLDPEKLAGQLNGLVDNIQKIQKVQQSAGSIFTNIKTAVQGFFNWIGSWFKR